MCKSVCAVLIDTVSIQEYIFSSSKLRENMGASYIVDNIFKEHLKSTLQKVFSVQNLNINEWKEKPGVYTIFHPDVEFEIGYIGGGNALILFKSKEKAKEFIKIFSKTLLEIAPGLKTAYGISEEFDLSEFSESLKKLRDNLIRNKNRFFPITTIAKYGFTADCPHTDGAADFLEKDGKFISGESMAKLNMAETARNNFKDTYISKEFANKYTFTYNIDDLTAKKGLLNYIAIVHIDGNKMGEKSGRCGSLKEIRLFSKEVEESSSEAFKKMISELINKIEEGVVSEKSGFYLKKTLDDGKEKVILPVIPIIRAGDEVTFISDGRLGIWLAEVYLKDYINKKVLGEKLSACAGVGIFKSKYPFYRAYILTEEVLKRAKKASREKENSSYLDFFISSRGVSGDLEDILKKYFKGEEGDLHYGPYRVDNDKECNSVKNLKNNIKEFKRYPKNKLMKLREVLFERKEMGEMFLEELKASKQIKLNNLPKSLWDNNQTPYFDAIELIDFYPEGLL
ncbi:HD domain-containing protein [Anaerocellum danielii]|uniref:Uncharacterized protein n=1 Tax=Anaerocellum danielii TaxID=1387557 RepID=A0ABZ0U0F7_9FIRM|nr:hypothetical protein [Caldicellulosiruptor danielii]WPX08962.1 hypothetical protein SOJ16_000128 [Caldicellulosiruptor danielii]